jgi:hypothetical protein
VNEVKAKGDRAQTGDDSARKRGSNSLPNGPNGERTLPPAHHEMLMPSLINVEVRRVCEASAVNRRLCIAASTALPGAADDAVIGTVAVTVKVRRDVVDATRPIARNCMRHGGWLARLQSRIF